MNDPRFFAGAFLFLSIVVVVYFGLFPTSEDIQDRGEERAIVEEALGTAQRESGFIDEELSFFAGLDQSFKDRVFLALPAERDIPNLLVLLERTVIESGLLLENISLSDPQAASALAKESGKILHTLSFSVRARGGYASVKELVLRLENLLRVTNIDSLSVVPIRTLESGGQDLFTISVSATTYFYQ